MKEAIGIIGYGNMGSAVAEQIKSQYPVFVFDKDKNKTAKAKGINISEDIKELAARALILILAVKPQDCAMVLREIKDSAQQKLIISLLAAVSCADIEKVLGNARVIRAMPNMLIKVRQGITCLAKGNFAQDGDLESAQKLFALTGETLVIEEALMNAATAVSGSAPGFFYGLLEIRKIMPDKIPAGFKEDFKRDLKNAAEEIGFSTAEAESLASGIAAGSELYLKKSGLSPTELKQQIASKGGTTEAGLAVLGRGGVLAEAVKAALSRAEELAKKE